MKKQAKLLIIFTAVLSLAGLLWTFVPSPVSHHATAMVRVRAANCYRLVCGVRDTLYFPLFAKASCPLAFREVEVADTVDISGVFVSKNGHVLTTDSLVKCAPQVLSVDVVRGRLQQADTLLHNSLRLKRGQLAELNDYARLHAAIDDGYNEVMAYREQVEREVETLGALSKKLQSVLKSHLAEAQLHSRVELVVAADSSVYSASVVKRSPDLLLLQTQSEKLPHGATRFSVYRWGCYARGATLWAFNDFGGPTAGLQPKPWTRGDSLFPAAEGGAWINASGNLCGIRRGERRIGSAKLADLLREVSVWPVWWWKNLKATAETLVHGVTPGVAKCTPSKDFSLACIRMQIGDSAVYEGQVKSLRLAQRALRQGYGLLRCADGVRYAGYWEADSLVRGERIDSVGCYNGGFNAAMRPMGYGSYYAADGTCYRGEWKDGLRQGLGFSVSADRMVHCGSWKENRFVGERLVYNADRVYGIDISRYQHEKGKKRFAIQWDKLRITDLGMGRRVHGRVDYPVSFVYIKSTEGRSVLNRYYASDVRQARAHGIAVGTYHFFSPTSTGAAQAAHFLKYARFAVGDLPPVLDLEPTEAQVKQMGGDAAMFRQVQVWLNTVERRCGRRPVLYISQQFVNKHMTQAPEALRNYEVWIARYGEFKPYVRLLHWQLTPYGRVRGIQGEVDINIFNGTREMFEEYLSKLK